MMSATRLANPRRFAGLLGASLFAAGCFFVSSYADRSAGVGVGLSALVIGVALAMWPAWQASSRFVPPIREGLAFTALGSTGVVLAMYLFVHLSDERYLWVIALAGVCSHMGSAAILFTAIMITLMLTAGALGLLLSNEGALGVPWKGTAAALVVAGLAITVSTALPEVVAGVLRCI